MSLRKCPVFRTHYRKPDGHLLSDGERNYLQGFYRAFVDESDAELERKRDVFRKRVLQHKNRYPPPSVLRQKRMQHYGYDKDRLDKEKLDILTYIIRTRSKRGGFGSFMRRYQLGGAFVVALISLGVFGLQQCQSAGEKREDTKKLAAAFQSEIYGMVHFNTQTTGSEYLESLYTELQKDVVWEPLDRPPEKHVPVYEASAKELGLLGPCLARSIGEFYAILVRLRENVRFLGNGRYMNLELKDKKVWLRAFIELEEKWNRLGREIVRDLQKVVGGETVTCE